jgi:hypothetical protein
MRKVYTEEQILKYIESFPQAQQQEIRLNLEKGNKDYDFAKAYGFDPKQFSRAEIELGFGQLI